VRGLQGQDGVGYAPDVGLWEFTFDLLKADIWKIGFGAAANL
jgi:hypothetical protein